MRPEVSAVPGGDAVNSFHRAYNKETLLAQAKVDALDGLDEAKEIVSESLAKVSQLSLPEVEWFEDAA